MDANQLYAKYMLSWLCKLRFSPVKEVDAALQLLEKYWVSDQKIDLEEIRSALWDWVDLNGGAAILAGESMLYCRMVLCLAYEDNRELEDMGFFDDLLCHLGNSRSEINKFRASFLPNAV